jgi:hypothetical protein
MFIVVLGAGSGGLVGVSASFLMTLAFAVAIALFVARGRAARAGTDAGDPGRFRLPSV